MTEAPRFEAARVRGVIFDLDGTLVDSYAAITESLNHARSRHALAPLGPAEVRRSVGRGLEALIADLVGADCVEQGVVAFRERYAEIYAEKTIVLPGVAATLGRLSRSGLRMSVASNKPARFGVPILRELGLLERFATVQGPDRVGTTKPDPAMLRACLAEMGLREDESLYVGDMVLDVETGRRAGVPVLLVDGGSSNADELRATGCRVLRQLPELADLLGSRATGS